jgi:phospholipase C
MMENRSFDHMLGYSGITGKDTQTGATTAVEGLIVSGGNEIIAPVQFYNDYTYQTNQIEISVTNTGPVIPTGPIDPVISKDPIADPVSKLRSTNPPPPPPPPPIYATARYPATTTAGDTIYNQHDVKHQFFDVMRQLCGQGQATIPLNGRPYPPVAEATKTGFAADYALNSDGGNPGEPMRCFDPKNLPVLNALASEFVVCDHWFSSMAGPTEPNRMFAHAATSGVWDDSPDFDDYLSIFTAKTIDPFGGSGSGIAFENGTIFDALRRNKIPFRIYTGDSFPQVGLLAGISLYSDVDDFGDFAADVSDPGYDAVYTFIEPRYDTITQQLDEKYGLNLSFVNNSQHPANSVTLGEALIKSVYEAIRNSPLWNECMLIIAWDEHGGFYDHVPPPRAKPTGVKGGINGFMFDQYGPRVPAVVISPWCPQNMVEHRQLEHAFIPATIEQVCGLRPLTIRDTGITGLQKLATLSAPRTVTKIIPDPISAEQIAQIQPKKPAPGTIIDSPAGPSGGPIFGGPSGGIKAQLADSAPEAPVKSVGTPTPPVASAPVVPVGRGPVASAPVTQTGSSLPLDLSDPWLASTLAVAMKAHMQAVPADAASIQARVAGLKTGGDLAQYYNDITPIINSARVLARAQKVAARKQLVP